MLKLPNGMCFVENGDALIPYKHRTMWTPMEYDLKDPVVEHGPIDDLGYQSVQQQYETFTMAGLNLRLARAFPYTSDDYPNNVSVNDLLKDRFAGWQNMPFPDRVRAMQEVKAELLESVQATRERAAKLHQQRQKEEYERRVQDAAQKLSKPAGVEPPQAPTST